MKSHVTKNAIVTIGKAHEVRAFWNNIEKVNPIGTTLKTFIDAFGGHNISF
jgi:hypothetical protein